MQKEVMMLKSVLTMFEGSEQKIVGGLFIGSVALGATIFGFSLAAVGFAEKRLEETNE